jgi:hypothetical protein
MTAFKFKSPDGEIIKGKNLSEFCRKHNLNYDNMRKLLKGKVAQCKGWFSTTSAKSLKRLDGIKETLYNLNTGQVTRIGLSQTKLAASYQLNKSKLNRLLRGKRLMYRGWVLSNTYSILYGKPKIQKLGRNVT